MRFEIAEVTKTWTLQEAMFKRIRKSELERLKKCPIGELFTEPLQIFTPRNNFRMDKKNGKVNDFVQVTIIGSRINSRVNGDLGLGDPPLFPHIIEGLIPTTTVLNQKLGEYLTRMSGPVENDWTETNPAHRFNYKLGSGQGQVYDFTKVCDYSKERMMKTRAVLAKEQVVEVAQGGAQGLERIQACRRKNRVTENVRVYVPIFNSLSMSTNKTTGGDFIYMDSISLLNGWAKRIPLAIKNNKQLFSRYVSTKLITGDYYNALLKSGI